MERGDPVTSVLEKVYFAAGGACLFYYLMLGAFARFGLNMSWLWLVAAAVLALSGLACRAALPGWVRAAWRALLAAGALLLAALLGLVISGMHAAPPADLDAVIVLGARVEADGEPSRALRQRVETAAAYLQANPDAIAVASGGQGADEPVSEAACIREALIAAGIAPERIRLEDRSATTAENLAFSRALLDAQGDSVGIVTNNYHVWRAVALARRAGYADVHGIAAPYAGVTLPHFMVREAACLVAEWLRGNL